MSEIKEPEDRQPKAATPKPTHKTITIAGNEYPAPRLGRMKRSSARRMDELRTAIVSGGAERMEDMWAMVEILMPELPAEDTEDLTLDDVKMIIQTSGLINFTDEDAVDPDDLTITLGESLASSNS